MAPRSSPTSDFQAGGGDDTKIPQDGPMLRQCFARDDTQSYEYSIAERETRQIRGTVAGVIASNGHGVAVELLSEQVAATCRAI